MPGRDARATGRPGRAARRPRRRRATSSARASIAVGATPAARSRSRAIARVGAPGASTAAPSSASTPCTSPRRLAQRRARARVDARCSSVPSMSNSSRSGGAQRRKSVSGVEPPRERRDQPRRVLHVVELDHLDRRVHVAQRDRHDAASGCRRARCGSRRRRCPCARAEAVDGERDALGLGRLVQQLEHRRVERRAAREHRPGAELVAAELLLVDARLVGGERHVDRDRDVRAQRVRGRARAAEGDLLLRDRDARTRRRARRPPRPPAAPPRSATKQPRRLSIERETKRPLGNSTGSPAITATSPMRTSARARRRRRAAPMSMCRSLQLRDLLAVLVLQQVDRLLADHAGDDAVARGDLDPLADEDDRVPAADAGEPEEARRRRCGGRSARSRRCGRRSPSDRPVAGAGHARDGRADRVVA